MPLLYAVAAGAVPELSGPLEPDLQIERPSAIAAASVQKGWAPCPAGPPPRLAQVPFGPGEVLEYEADILGYDVAELTSRVEAPTTFEGHEVWPIRAEVHSDLLLRVAASFDGEMRTWVRRDTLAPVRSVSRFRADSPRKDLYTRDDVAFHADEHGAARSRSRFVTDEDDVTEDKDLTARLPLQDVLSAVYHARSLDLAPGLVACHDIYLMGGVFQTVATVEAVERVDVDYDERDAFRVRLRYGPRDKGEDTQLVVTTWISRDRERLPLRLLIEE